MDAKDTSGNTGAEAPCSWNVRYLDAAGFQCQLTIRGASGSDVLGRAAVALEWLGEHGARPEGKPPARQTPEEADPAWCSIHHCAMKQRTANGETWYSHKAPDGTWCKGKVEPLPAWRGPAANGG